MKLSMKIFLVITFLTSMLLLINGGLIVNDSFQQEVLGAKQAVIATNRLVANQLWQSDQQQNQGLTKGQIINLATVTHTSVVISDEKREPIYEKGVKNHAGKKISLKDTDRQQVQFLTGKSNYVVASLKVEFKKHTYYISSLSKIDAIIFNRNQLIQKIWLYLTISVGVNLLLTYFVMQRMLKPIRLLKSSSRLFQLNNHEFVPLKVTGDDELADLTKAYNLMAMTIKHNLEKAEEQALLQKQFSRNLTHEINTPLTIILGYAELLQRDQMDKHEKQEALNYIIEESSRLQKLGSRLKQLIQYEHAQPHWETYATEDLASMIKQMITGIKQKTDKDFKFKLDLAASKLQIDQALFKELMINLLDNAIQALPENEGCLKVSGSLLQDTYQLQLVDNGKGIDTEMMNRVFDPFVSGQKYEGNHLGLGLAITRQIVTSLNWRITIGNTKTGGARVNITIPREVNVNEE